MHFFAFSFPSSFFHDAAASLRLFFFPLISQGRICHTQNAARLASHDGFLPRREDGAKDESCSNRYCRDVTGISCDSQRPQQLAVCSNAAANHRVSCRYITLVWLVYHPTTYQPNGSLASSLPYHTCDPLCRLTAVGRFSSMQFPQICIMVDQCLGVSAWHLLPSNATTSKIRNCSYKPRAPCNTTTACHIQ